VAGTLAKNGKPIEATLGEIALGYEQDLGRELAGQYCVRCHDTESTRERVSNFDNLDPKPHVFTDCAALNKLSDSDLIAIITHGGPALSRSPQMPPYGYTLSKNEIQALTSYIRAVADPPYHASGVIYAHK
jgi:mono/diheme cytochrome c family protein